MENLSVKIEGMHCKACAMGVEAKLEELSFVSSASVDFKSATAEIVCSSAPDMEAIKSAVKEAGFSA